MATDGDFVQPRFKLDSQPPKYRWRCTIPDVKGTNRTATYGLTFNERPPKYHAQQPGHYWNDVWGNSHVDDAFLEKPIATSKPWRHLFATVNKHRLSIYEAKAGCKPRLLQRYSLRRLKCEHEEDLYCCAWVFNADGKRNWWVLAAGEGRVVWCIDPLTGKHFGELLGHGEAIYDLKVHPRDPSLVVTASKDESLRLWNLRTFGQVAIFHGLRGHHGEVIGVDWDREGTRFASCSIDYSVRIWDVTRDKDIVDAIREAHRAADSKTLTNQYYYVEDGVRKKCKIPSSQLPPFVTRSVHKHYVDCVRWIGDALLTKSLHNQVFLWLPGADRASLSSKANDYTLLQEYLVSGCDLWFVRFALNASRSVLAVGGRAGRVDVFNLKEYSSKPLTLRPKDLVGDDDKSTICIRQCAFSDDSSILITVDDKANVVQYDTSEVSKSKQRINSPKPAGRNRQTPVTANGNASHNDSPMEQSDVEMTPRPDTLTNGDAAPPLLRSADRNGRNSPDPLNNATPRNPETPNINGTPTRNSGHTVNSLLFPNSTTPTSSTTPEPNRAQPAVQSPANGNGWTSRTGSACTPNCSNCESPRRPTPAPNGTSLERQRGAGSASASPAVARNSPPVQRRSGPAPNRQEPDSHSRDPPVPRRSEPVPNQPVHIDAGRNVGTNRQLPRNGNGRSPVGRASPTVQRGGSSRSPRRARRKTDFDTSSDEEGVDVDEPMPDVRTVTTDTNTGSTAGTGNASTNSVGSQVEVVALDDDDDDPVTNSRTTAQPTPNSGSAGPLVNGNGYTSQRASNGNQPTDDDVVIVISDDD